jgi:hypothetical protein
VRMPWVDRSCAAGGVPEFQDRGSGPGTGEASGSQIDA